MKPRATLLIIGVAATVMAVAGCHLDSADHQARLSAPKPYTLKFCVIGHEPLVEAPAPIEIIYAGRQVKLATPLCAEKFRADPEKYIKAIENAEHVFATAKGFAWVEPKEYERLRSTGKVVVLDVRTPAEFAAGHVPGALNLDLNGSDFTNRVETLDRSKTYLVNCTAGVRGAKACDLLHRLQFSKLFNLDGGLAAWEHAGNRPETGLPATNAPATH
jgi:rhodanese-related sulfurtransferase